MTFMLTIISKWKWLSTLNVCACVVNTWTTYRYIHTYIHKYSDFLVAMINVYDINQFVKEMVKLKITY